MEFKGSKFISAGVPHGFGAIYRTIGEGKVETMIVFGDEKEGPPGHAHGGAIAAMLDETMGMSCFAAKRPGLAVNLNVNYKAAVPLGADVRFEGHVDKIDGRKTFAIGRATLSDGTIAAESSGVFVFSQELFDKLATLYQERLDNSD